MDAGMPSSSLRDAYRSFTTGCALITTDGPEGPNVMAAEWTFNVSYDPFLVLVSMDPENRTHNMILESKEFGVSLVSESQLAAMAFAGHHSKTDTDKLSSTLFETFPGRKIRAPLIRGSILAAECRLVQTIPLGDHVGFLGEVVEFTVDPEARPVVLHQGSRHLGDRIAREPGVAVAVTPMETQAGRDVTAKGELLGPNRGASPVSLQLVGPKDDILAEIAARSAEDGSFLARIRIPPVTPPGDYRLMVRAVSVEGSARLRVR